jgi:hypothetical protein
MALDELNLLTERRLLHAETLRSPCDVAFLGNGDEVAEMPKVESHIGTIWISGRRENSAPPFRPYDCPCGSADPLLP